MAGLFSDTISTTTQEQFELTKQVVNSLFIGVVLINIKHKIVFANKTFAEKVSMEPGMLIDTEIHAYLSPDFRDRHRQILNNWFKNPYRVAIERRSGNEQDMKVVPFGKDTKPDTWLKARIGISPILVPNSSEVFQTGELIKPTILGLAEIGFAETFN